MAVRRPLNLGAPATTVGFRPLPQMPTQAAPRAAPREDNTRAATAYGMAEALAQPIQVESGTWGEAIAEALAGGLRGRAARTERLSELDQRDVARALEREQANQELKGEIQDRDLRARILEQQVNPAPRFEGGAGFTNAYRINPDGTTTLGGALPLRPLAPRGGLQQHPDVPEGFELE